MKKILFIACSLAIAFIAGAQKAVPTESAPTYQEIKTKVSQKDYRTESSATRLIWSEDFANDIPANWSQNGTPALALWEYRGPNTSPNDTVGSIGCWADTNQFGNKGEPILSPTRSNGFMIFDSDFLNSNGNRATDGSGPVPAPHTGRLRTGVIDLSAEPDVELSFYNYARRFQAAWYVAISIDSGQTFTDTLEVFPVSELDVNRSTEQDAFYRENISYIAANQSQVVLEFIFDGTVFNDNGSGRYFWMIDDIEINTPPENLLRFTAGTAPGTTGEAPAQDIIFNNDSDHPRHMHMAEKQIVPLVFDANIYNYGIQTQTNVALEVEIRDANTNTVVTTLTSPAFGTLPSLDTAYYNTFTTPSWTPSQAGDYQIIYKAISDSILSTNTATADTFNFFVGDKIGLDDRTIENYFGTNTNINAMGVMFSVEADDPTGDAGLAHIQGVEIDMSRLTDSTGDIEFAIYDTAGFQFASGGFASNPLYTTFVTLDGSVPGNIVNFSFEASNGRPLTIPTGTYYVVATFFVNAVDGVIRVANSATFEQPPFASIFFTDDGNWRSFFTNSNRFISPHFRVVLADASDISLNENELEAFSVYPNPTTGKGFIEFTNRGHYELNVHNMIGDEMYNSHFEVSANEKIAIDFSHLSAGVYLVTLNNKGEMKTVKLTIK